VECFGLTFDRRRFSAQAGRGGKRRGKKEERGGKRECVAAHLPFRGGRRSTSRRASWRRERRKEGEEERHRTPLLFFSLRSLTLLRAREAHEKKGKREKRDHRERLSFKFIQNLLGKSSFKHFNTYVHLWPDRGKKKKGKREGEAGYRIACPLNKGRTSSNY